jgi:cobalt-zinc-cadmium resistance protein CzcA
MIVGARLRWGQAVAAGLRFLPRGSQPIQTRFNERLAGVRSDAAVKVFGDEFEPLLRAADQVASILSNTKGAKDAGR